MNRVSELRQQEVETYFNVIAKGGSDRRIRGRSFHNLGELDAADYGRISDELLAVDATSSFSFLGRDAEQYANVIESLDADGHEIVLHGYRHLACADISYDLAHENLTRGMRAIEEASGVTPRGFIAPGQTVNAATLKVVAEIDLDWVVGSTEATVPPGLAFHEVTYPYDLIILNQGASPAEAFEQISHLTESGSIHLLHPNMLEYYNALTPYYDWIRDTSPVSVGTFFKEGGIGLINDAMRPLRIE